jgi:branched-chain amino acid aminotransferase
VKYIFLNGKVVSSENATIPVLDRGFLYGDGLFETMRVSGGQPHLWDEHMTRLSHGAELLRIAIPFDSAALRKHAAKLLDANELADTVLRVHLSRGVAPRGYSPREAKTPVMVMTTHELPPAPESWKLATTSFRLPPLNPLSPFKTSNKLLNVLAKAEAESHGADEGLLLTDSGALAQGASSNLFWIEGRFVCTAPEQTGILPGITRAAVLRVCEEQKVPVRQTTVQPERLHDSAGVFVTLSTFGIVEASALDGRELPRSEITTQLRNALFPGADLSAATLPLSDGF